MIDKERHAVRNELNMYLNKPTWKLWDTIYKNFYTSEGLQYSNDYLQQLKVLKTFNKTNLEMFLKNTFNNRRILFVITGKFQKNNIIKILRQKLKPAIEKPICIKPCFSLKKKVLFIKNEKSKNTDIKLIFPINIVRGDPEFIYLSMLSSIIGGDFSSLLMRELRVKKELVYGAKCSFVTDFCGSTCSINISTLDKNVVEVLHTVFKIIKIYKKTRISKKLLSNVKNKHLITFYENSFEGVNQLSSFFKFQFLFQMHKKKKKIYTYNDYVKIIKNVSTKKIQSLINKIFNTEHCLIGYIGKKKANFTEKDY